MMLRYYVKPSGQYMGAASIPVDADPAKVFNPLRDAGYIEVPEPGQSAAWFWDFSANTWYLPASASMEDERSWRDAELAEWAWLRDRHRDQTEIGVQTSLTAEQFSNVLVYLQKLRDWPQSEAFPDPVQRPQAPVFFEQMGDQQ